MKKLLFCLLLFASLNFAQSDDDYSQTFISVKNTGVQEFLQTYPEYDGRGTIIFIIDSGVDTGIDGLLKTTTGETKVIDVQDFSGEGNTKFYKAKTDEIDDTLYFINKAESLKVAGVDGIKLKPVDDKYFIGSLDEKRWMNSDAHTTDINGNGTTDDKFVFVTFKTDDNDWVLYIDTDSDGSLENEQPLKNYKLNHDTFTIKNEFGLSPYTFAVNIFPENNEVVFHFDAIAHGTHCAGIAAGYHIGNNDLNGVAPGAYLGSLKLGNSIIDGLSTSGSMKAAYEYADKISRERNEPVIINMSYGIGSEIESESEMEHFLDQLVSANPYLYIATSNGNEGPGISTTGLPASSSSVFSSGAVLAKELGADLYGAMLDKDIILHFSSRGGEINKPDVVAPGAATSTVPLWTDYDRFWGTSMASPYSAGVMSLLLSAMKAEYPDVKIPSTLLYKALKESAKKLDGYSPLDQGSGLINVMEAYKLLKKYVDEGEIDKLETYTVTSFAPNTPSGEGHSFYLRNGAYLSGTETFSFNIKRNNFIKQDKFYRTYKIESGSDWLVPITKRTYLRNDQTTKINFKFDKEKMKEPGLYSTKLKAYRADISNFPEFEMLASVVIPYEFTPENKYSKKFEGKLAPAEVKRIFLNVPAGSTIMKVKLSHDESDYTKTWYAIHDPEGKPIESSALLNSESNDHQLENYFYDLVPGIYELDLVGYYRAVDSVNYKLDVEFLSLETSCTKHISKSKNSINVTNRYNTMEEYNLSGEVTGYEKSYSLEIENDTEYRMPFTINADEKEKRFKFLLSKEDYNKTTDFGIQIFDQNGRAVSVSNFSYKDAEISIYNSASEESREYTLVLSPGFVEKTDNMVIDVKEETLFNESLPVSVNSKGKSLLILYPSIMENLDLNYDISEVDFPENSTPMGRLYFNSPESDKTIYELPLYFNLEKGVSE